MNQMLPTSRVPQTMSSREIAALTGKAHKNVIRDIVLMIEAIEKDGSDLIHQAKSEGYVRHMDARGYTSSFDLDQDLTYNLVLGYDAALRLKVVRRWMELESGEAPAKVSAPRKSISGFSRTFEALHKIAVRHLGLDEAQATIHASHGTDYLHGFNPLEAMRVSRIESPVEKAFFVVTDIAKREGFQSAQWLNKAFEALGLQTDTGNEDCRWKPTDLGRPYCRVVDNPIKGRRSRQSLMWSLDVVPLVRAHLGTSATPYGAVSATSDDDLLGGIK